MTSDLQTAVATISCRLCDDSGWADPWEVHDGAPMLTWCSDCLGAGLDACVTCDGEGVVPEPTPCPCVTGELDGVPLAA